MRRILNIALAATLLMCPGQSLCAAPSEEGTNMSGKQTGTPPGKVVVGSDGAAQVREFALPFSNLASPEAKADFIERASHPLPSPTQDIVAFRKGLDDALSLPMLARQNARYAAAMEPRTIGGVYTEVFTPKDGVATENKDRVLINLHGGGFIMGARTVGAIESVPIASIGRITVISIDYRLAPEHRFPAASEDVAAVYRELLKRYKPSQIGIYGCSAGGMLGGQSMAWFQKEGLPIPAALGVFCATLGDFDNGDSAWLSSAIGGMLPPPSPNAQLPYFIGADRQDPLAYPVVSPVVLAKFPPTLFITGTRAKELSSAVHSHIQLVKAGVDAELAVWEGMDHAFLNNPDLPESREAYDVIVKFFGKHLGKSGK